MIKALLFSRLVFLAAVAAMLAGNASAVEQSDDGIIDYVVDEFTDEKRIYFLKSLSRGSGLIFRCEPDSITVSFRPESRRFSESNLYLDVKMRIDDAPYQTMKGYDGGSSGALFSDGGSLDKRMGEMTVKEFLGKLIAGDSFIVKVGNTKTMRFDLPAIRTKLARFEKECQELQE